MNIIFVRDIISNLFFDVITDVISENPTPPPEEDLP